MILHNGWAWGGLFLALLLVSWYANDWFDRHTR